MARTSGEDCQHTVDPARKYIRCQIAGWFMVCSWPVAMYLAAMYGFGHIIYAMSVLLLMTAVIIFAIGHVGRQELKERKE